MTKDYELALQKIWVASGHIRQGEYGNARRVLNSAALFGELDQRGHLAGRLQHDALQALLLLVEKRNPSQASEKLLAVVAKVSRLNGKSEQEETLVYCHLAMDYFPHVIEIRKYLEKARVQASRNQFEGAYIYLRDARQLAKDNHNLTPPAIRKQIATTSKEVMGRLQKLPKATAAATITYLKERGLL